MVDDDFEQELAAAKARTAQRDPRTYATAVRYVPGGCLFAITLASGHRFHVPADFLQGLEDAPDRDLATVELTSLGDIYIPAVDEGFTTSGLVEGRYGSDRWMKSLRERVPESRLGPPRLEAPGTELFPTGQQTGSQQDVVRAIREHVDHWRGFALAPAREPYPEDPPAYEATQSWERPLSPTSQKLLRHWFRHEPHELPAGTTFKYWPHQRRAVETFIYLHEVCGLRRSEELFKLTGIEALGTQRDPWAKLGGELATGSGKTKVMSLLIAWSYFNAVLHGDAYLGLGRHSLVIAPGLFVRDRLLLDFRPEDGSPSVFLADPVLPSELRDLWDVRVYGPEDCPLELDPAIGALVVTNYHRLLNEGDDVEEELERTAHESQMDLLFKAGEPKKLEDISTPLLERFVHSRGLLVINDEAHRVGDEPQHIRFETKGNAKGEKVEMAWVRALRLLNGGGYAQGRLGLQIDLSATLFEEQGVESKVKTLFRHTAVQYPLVEAKADGIIKKPVLEKVNVIRDGRSIEPVNDAAANAWDKYRVLIETGIERWKKVQDQLREEGDPRKPLLLLLCEDRKQAGSIANFLTYGDPTIEDLSHRTPTGWKDPRTGEVLFLGQDADGQPRSTVIEVHVGEKEDKNEKEWAEIRRKVNFIDRDHVASDEKDAYGRRVQIPNPYNVIVSVLMLREGWDVRNVKVIVPLRPCGSRTLTEQVLGRGLRKMHAPHVEEDGAITSRDEELYVIEHPSFATVLDEIKDLVDVKNSGEIDHAPDYLPIVPRADEAARALRDVRLVRFDGLYEEQPDWQRDFKMAAVPALSPRLAWQDAFSDLEIETRLREAFARRVEGQPEDEEGLSFTIGAETSYADFDAVLSEAYVKPLLATLKLGYSQRPAIKGVVREFLERKTFALGVGVRLSFDASGEPEETRVLLGNLARPEVMERVRVTLLPLLDEAIRAAQPETKARLLVEHAADLQAYQAVRRHVLEPSRRSPFVRQAMGNDLELRAARMLDGMEDVTGWVYNHRRAPGFSIEYVWRDLRVPYYPDFLVRARLGEVVHQFIVETKGRFDDRDRAKADAGLAMCELLTRHDSEPWHYLLLLENEKVGRTDLADLEALGAPTLREALRRQEEHGIFPGGGTLPLARSEPEILAEVPESERYRSAVPVFDLVPRGGGFSASQVPQAKGWMRPQAGRRLGRGMYVAKVEGRSMEPGVASGSWCLFRGFEAGRAPSPVALDGRRVVVQLRGSGEETGGGTYTLKRLRVRARDSEGAAARVELAADNPLFPDRVLEASSEDVRIVAELLEVVG